MSRSVASSESPAAVRLRLEPAILAKADPSNSVWETVRSPLTLSDVTSSSSENTISPSLFETFAETCGRTLDQLDITSAPALVRSSLALARVVFSVSAISMHSSSV
jgi:hypothetical protein